MPIEFLVSATTEFQNLQSGNARPFFYVEGLVSGTTSIFGISYTSTNWLMDGGVIDRQKAVLAGDRGSLFSSDVTIKLDNSTRRFSPSVTGSEFFGQEYLQSPVNYWAGFVNISGTALLLQRGAFILDDLKIDTRKNIASLRLKDKFKKALETKVGISVSGTAIPLVFTGQNNGKAIMESLLITGAGLTAGDVDIQTASTSFGNLTFDEQSVAEALQCVAEASDGFIFSTRDGKIKFSSYEPVWGTSTTAHYAFLENHNYENILWEQNKKDRLSTVIIAFSSGASSTFIVTSTSQSANSIKIDNECIQSTADAVAIGGRILDRFSGQITKIEIPAVWIPTIEIGQTIAVTNNNAGLVSALFEVGRIQEEITKGKMKITAFTDRSANGLGQFCFFSDPSAVVCGTVFTGATGESNGWQNSWAFIARTTTTAVNPRFDLDGNNNNVINTGFAASGAGSTGIENACQMY